MAGKQQARGSARGDQKSATSQRGGPAGSGRSGTGGRTGGGQGSGGANNRGGAAGRSGAGRSGAGQRGGGQRGGGQRGGTAVRNGNGRGPGQAAAGPASGRRGEATGRAVGQPADQGAELAEPGRLALGAQLRSMDWLQLSTLVLSLIGLGLSIYLTIQHFEYVPSTHGGFLGCPENSVINCGKVTTSAQSKLFGIFPVSELGLAFYLFMVVINSPWGWRSRLPYVWLVRLGSIVVGMLFVLYLIYAELFDIHAICLFCTGVHIVTFLLFTLVVFRATAPPRPAAVVRG